MRRIAILLSTFVLWWMSAGVLAGAAAPGPEITAAALERWGKDIAALEARDAQERHPEDSILFVGSSSIRLWETIEEDMAPYHPIRRGYGGARFSDAAVFAQRLIAPHRFRALVVFVANDVTGGDGDAAPDQVAGWFGHIVNVARAVEPEALVFCIEITPTRARWAAWPGIREVNRALARECAARPGVFFIPTAHAYLGADGQPRLDLFVDDRLHLNALGYRIWSAIITSHLDARLDPHYTGGATDCAPEADASAHAGRDAQAAAVRIPVLYCTDLFHPHDDPDDHFDIATLYAIPEFDLRGIVLDQGALQVSRPGRIPVAQLNALTGRNVPAAIGLASKLASPDDRGLDQGEAFQGGVRLIIDTLQAATRRVDFLSVGSVRDLTAAFNRRPDLFRERAGRVMVFIGEASDPSFREHNVGLDPQAYVGLMRSGLDLYWVPCFDGGLWRNAGRASFWRAAHADLLGSAPPELIQFFIYALEKETVDPIAFLRQPVDPARRAALFAQTRNLWCTAVFRSLAASDAPHGPGFVFEAAEAAIGDDALLGSPADVPARTVQRFRVKDPERYASQMTQATAEILARFPVVR